MKFSENVAIYCLDFGSFYGMNNKSLLEFAEGVLVGFNMVPPYLRWSVLTEMQEQDKHVIGYFSKSDNALQSSMVSLLKLFRELDDN